MHPILADVRRVALYLVAALAVGALVAAGFEGGGDQLLITLAVFLPASVVYALLCLSTWYLCRAFPLTPGASVGPRRAGARSWPRCWPVPPGAS